MGCQCPSNDESNGNGERAATSDRSDGFEVAFKTIVGDDFKDLVRVISAALSRADIVILSGGLGPTEDDLTREAVAETLGLQLRRDPEIVRAIERRFAEHGWKMSPNNVKQGDVIAGATENDLQRRRVVRRQYTGSPSEEYPEHGNNDETTAGVHTFHSGLRQSVPATAQRFVNLDEPQRDLRVAFVGLHAVGQPYPDERGLMPLRAQLLDELQPYRDRALDEHPWRDWAEADARSSEGSAASGQRRPGAQSRWTGGKDLSWEPVRIELVAEVAYEHLQGDRFRHTARFARWRPDRDPSSCTYAQLEVPVPMELQEIFGV
jgi:hypothetical protein